MKFCNICGIEIYTRDGDNTCPECEKMNEMKSTKKAAARRRARVNRLMREEILRSCGLTKVRGALGGIYWE
jgi:uncharacterized Zn finger protein (UPF0148 family)